MNTSELYQNLRFIRDLSSRSEYVSRFALLSHLNGIRHEVYENYRSAAALEEISFQEWLRRDKPKSNTLKVILSPEELDDLGYASVIEFRESALGKKYSPTAFISSSESVEEPRVTKPVEPDSSNVNIGGGSIPVDVLVRGHYMESDLIKKRNPLYGGFIAYDVLKLIAPENRNLSLVHGKDELNLRGKPLYVLASLMGKLNAIEAAFVHLNATPERDRVRNTALRDMRQTVGNYNFLGTGNNTDKDLIDPTKSDDLKKITDESIQVLAIGPSADQMYKINNDKQYLNYDQFQKETNLGNALTYELFSQLRQNLWSLTPEQLTDKTKNFHDPIQNGNFVVKFSDALKDTTTFRQFLLTDPLVADALKSQRLDWLNDLKFSNNTQKKKISDLITAYLNSSEALLKDQKLPKFESRKRAKAQLVNLISIDSEAAWKDLTRVLKKAESKQLLSPYETSLIRDRSLKSTFLNAVDENKHKYQTTVKSESVLKRSLNHLWANTYETVLRSLKPLGYDSISEAFEAIKSDDKALRPVLTKLEDLNGIFLERGSDSLKSTLELYNKIADTGKPGLYAYIRSIFDSTAPVSYQMAPEYTTQTSYKSYQGATELSNILKEMSDLRIKSENTRRIIQSIESAYIKADPELARLEAEFRTLQRSHEDNPSNVDLADRYKEAKSSLDEKLRSTISNSPNKITSTEWLKLIRDTPEVLEFLDKSLVQDIESKVSDIDKYLDSKTRLHLNNELEKARNTFNEGHKAISKFTKGSIGDFASHLASIAEASRLLRTQRSHINSKVLEWANKQYENKKIDKSKFDDLLEQSRLAESKLSKLTTAEVVSGYINKLVVDVTPLESIISGETTPTSAESTQSLVLSYLDKVCDTLEQLEIAFDKAKLEGTAPIAERIIEVIDLIKSDVSAASSIDLDQLIDRISLDLSELVQKLLPSISNELKAEYAAAKKAAIGDKEYESIAHKIEDQKITFGDVYNQARSKEKEYNDAQDEYVNRTRSHVIKSVRPYLGYGGSPWGQLTEHLIRSRGDHLKVKRFDGSGYARRNDLKGDSLDNTSNLNKIIYSVIALSLKDYFGGTSFSSRTKDKGISAFQQNIPSKSHMKKVIEFTSSVAKSLAEIQSKFISGFTGVSKYQKDLDNPDSQGKLKTSFKQIETGLGTLNSLMKEYSEFIPDSTVAGLNSLKSVAESTIRSKEVPSIESLGSAELTDMNIKSIDDLVKSTLSDLASDFKDLRSTIVNAESNDSAKQATVSGNWFSTGEIPKVLLNLLNHSWDFFNKSPLTALKELEKYINTTVPTVEDKPGSRGKPNTDMVKWMTQSTPGSFTPPKMETRDMHYAVHLLSGYVSGRRPLDFKLLSPSWQKWIKSVVEQGNAEVWYELQNILSEFGWVLDVKSIPTVSKDQKALKLDPEDESDLKDLCYRSVGFELFKNVPSSDFVSSFRDAVEKNKSTDEISKYIYDSVEDAIHHYPKIWEMLKSPLDPRNLGLLGTQIMHPIKVNIPGGISAIGRSILQKTGVGKELRLSPDENRKIHLVIEKSGLDQDIKFHHYLKELLESDKDVHLIPTLKDALTEVYTSIESEDLDESNLEPALLHRYLIEDKNKAKDILNGHRIDIANRYRESLSALGRAVEGDKSPQSIAIQEFIKEEDSKIKSQDFAGLTEDFPTKLNITDTHVLELKRAIQGIDRIIKRINTF